MSTRERIVEHVLATLRGLPAVKTVARRLLSHRALGEFAMTQLPVVAVVAGLPVPTAKRSDRRHGDYDAFISELNLDLFVYDYENEGTDARVSELADVMWRAFYADPTLGGLVLGMTLGFAGDVERWDPFVAFMLSLKTTYMHGKGGI